MVGYLDIPWATHNISTMGYHYSTHQIMKADRGMNPFQVWGDGNQNQDNGLYVDDLIDGLSKMEVFK